MPYFFINRFDAGKQLAKKLEYLRGQNALVLALPRGGVPIGLEVAKHLHIPLEVFISRKLGAPMDPEFGVGAISEGGIIVLDKNSLAALNVSDSELKDIIAKESAEMERRIDLYRGNRHNIQVKDRIVILVDDGLATGVTALAAMRSLKLSQPKKVIFAVPICSPETAENLRSEVDDLICLRLPQNFMSVGTWYKDFPQVSDQEVVDLLTQANHQIKIELPIL